MNNVLNRIEQNKLFIISVKYIVQHEEKKKYISQD